MKYANEVWWLLLEQALQLWLGIADNKQEKILLQSYI